MKQKSFEATLKEVRQNLEREARVPTSKDKPKYSLRDPKNVAFRKKYIGTEYDFLGLSSPQEELVYRRSFKSTEGLSFKERVAVWDYLWQHSRHYHVMCQALRAFADLVDEASTGTEHRALLKVLTRWLRDLDNWAHSDGLSTLLSDLLERAQTDKKLLAEHLRLRQKWNKSKNPWERRQSLVSLLNYATLRKKYLPYSTMIRFVEPLLADEAFYVQRGVGWTLREIYNLYPKETYAFLKKNVHNLSSIAFSASTEKLNAADKARLKTLRSKSSL